MRIVVVPKSQFHFFKVEAQTKEYRLTTSEARGQCLGLKILVWAEFRIVLGLVLVGPSLELFSGQRPCLDVVGGYPAHGPRSRSWPYPVGNLWDVGKSYYEKEFQQDKDVRV
ncbi:hypothetical protein ACFX2G_022096 [Malus domestica]